MSEQEHQGVRRTWGAAVLASGLFAATAALLLPRLLAIDRTASTSGPVPGPSPSGEAVFFPALAREANAYADWGAGGTLVEDEGCIFLREEYRGDWLVLWPHGWSVERTGGGALRILDDMGTSVVEVGDQVTLHGGPVGQYPTGPPERFPEELIGQPIPARCTAEAYFMTSGRLL